MDAKSLPNGTFPLPKLPITSLSPADPRTADAGAKPATSVSTTEGSRPKVPFHSTAYSEEGDPGY